jgi:hypothetical protein
MAGLVPAIHVLLFVAEAAKEDVDARDKRGHDVESVRNANYHECPLAQLDALRRDWSVFCQ